MQALLIGGAVSAAQEARTLARLLIKGRPILPPCSIAMSVGVK